MSFHAPVSGADAYAPLRKQHMHAAIHASPLTKSQQAILRYIERTGYDVLYMGIDTIAEVCKLARRTVQGAMRVLSDTLGILEMTAKESWHLNTPRTYRVHREMITPENLARACKPLGAKTDEFCTLSLTHETPSAEPEPECPHQEGITAESSGSAAVQEPIAAKKSGKRLHSHGRGAVCWLVRSPGWVPRWVDVAVAAWNRGFAGDADRINADLRTEFDGRPE